MPCSGNSPRSCIACITHPRLWAHSMQVVAAGDVFICLQPTDDERCAIAQMVLLMLHGCVGRQVHDQVVTPTAIDHPGVGSQAGALTAGI